MATHCEPLQRTWCLRHLLCGKAQAAKMIGDELQTLKANCYAKGGATTSLVLAIGDDGEFF
jgi:hypothetical protein